MSKTLPWFRLYHRMVDDEKIRLLAFEDRWHFIAICCLKADGLIDEPEGDLRQRKIAVKLGVQVRELDEITRRLFEVGLVDKNMQPVAWGDLQYKSDSSSERVKKYRAKTKGSNAKRQCNVSVTPQDTDTDTDTERNIALFDQFWKAYPKRIGNNPKKPAQQKFLNALKRGVDSNDIMAGVIAYADERKAETNKQDDAARFTKTALVWLNQECWSEYVENGQKSNSRTQEEIEASRRSDDLARLLIAQQEEHSNAH